MALSASCVVAIDGVKCRLFFCEFCFFFECDADLPVVITGGLISPNNTEWTACTSSTPDTHAHSSMKFYRQSVIRTNLPLLT